MMIAWTVIILIICHINFVLHVIGFYLLVCLYKNSKHTVQRLCLIHLSLLDALKNFLFIPYLCMELEGMKMTVVQQYMDICLVTVIPSLYYSLIIFITADRFLAICLSIKYRINVTVRRSKLILTSIWVISILICALLSILYYNRIISLNFQPYNMYIYLSLDLVFIITALGTYIFIFGRYNSLAMETQRCVLHNVREDAPKTQTVFQRFRHSKFYTSAIIIGNFMMLVAIPDVVFTSYLHISTTDPPYAAIAVLTMLNLLSDTCDFVIYVFIQKQVRNLFLKNILLCLKRKPQNNSLLHREPAVRRSVYKDCQVSERSGTTCSDLSYSEV